MLLNDQFNQSSLKVKYFALKTGNSFNGHTSMGLPETKIITHCVWHISGFINDAILLAQKAIFLKRDLNNCTISWSSENRVIVQKVYQNMYHSTYQLENYNEVVP